MSAKSNQAKGEELILASQKVDLVGKLAGTYKFISENAIPEDAKANLKSILDDIVKDNKTTIIKTLEE